VTRLRIAAAVAACAALLALPACRDDKPASGAGAPADATSTPTPDRPAMAY
jgi:hypothetical protein